MNNELMDKEVAGKRSNKKGVILSGATRVFASCVVEEPVLSLSKEPAVCS